MASKPIDVQKLTQRKVTVPLVLLLGVAVVGFRFNGITVGYLDNFFITKAVAEEQYKELSEQLASNTQIITAHIRTYELNENAKDMRRTEDHMYDLDLYIAANGENQLTRTRKRDLGAELARLKRVRACIVRNDSNENCAAVI